MAEIRPWSELEPEVRKLPPEQQQAARESYFQMLIDRGVYQAPGSHSGARVPKDPALGTPIPEEGGPAGDLTGETRPSEFLAPKAALLGQLGRMAGPGQFELGRPRLVTHPETGELVTPEQAREHRVLRPVEAFEAGAASSPLVRLARGRGEPFEPAVGWRGAVERGAGALGRVAPGATAVGLGQLAGLPAPLTAPAVFGGEAGLGEYQREQEAGEPTSPLRIGAAGVGTGALVAGAPELGSVAEGLMSRLARPAVGQVAGLGTEAATFGVGGEALQSRLEGRPYDPAAARESTATGGALFGTLRAPRWLRSLRGEAAPVNEPARTTPGAGEGAPRGDEPAFVAGLQRERVGPPPRIAPPVGQAYAAEPPVQEAEIVPERLALPPPRVAGGTVTGGPVPPGPVPPPAPGVPTAPVEARPAPGGGQVIEPAGVPGLDFPEPPGDAQPGPVGTPPPPSPAPAGPSPAETEAVLNRLRGGLRGKGRAPEPGGTGTEDLDRAQTGALQQELQEAERVAREGTNPKGRPLPAGMVADAARDAARLRERLQAVGVEPPTPVTGPASTAVPPELEAVFQGKARAFLRPSPEEGTVPTAGEQALAGTDLRKLARDRRASYFKGKDGSEVVFDPQQVSRRELSGLDKAGRLAEVVNGEGTSPKPAVPKQAVVVRTPAGEEARTVLTATPAATEAAIRAQPEGFSTEVAPAETAVPKVLGERQEAGKTPGQTARLARIIEEARAKLQTETSPQERRVLRNQIRIAGGTVEPAESPGSREAVRAAMGRLGPEESVAAAQRLQALVDRINNPEKAPKTPAALNKLVAQARDLSRQVGLGEAVPGAEEALRRALGREGQMAARRFDVYGGERFADPELERLRLAVARAQAEAPQRVQNVRQQQKSDQRIANAKGELEGALRAYQEHAGGEPERLPAREVPAPRPRPGERGSFSLRPRKPLPLPAQKVMEHVSVGEKEPRDLSLSTLYTRAVDDLYPMKEMSDELGKADSFAENPYILGRLQRGWQGRAEHFIEKGPFRFGDLERVPGPSLHDVFAPVLGEIEEARAYLVARHALELAAKGKDTGIPTDAAQQTVRLLDSPRMRELVRAHQQYWDGVTRYVADAGLLTPEARARIAGAYEAYVPFQRVVEALRTGGTGRRFGNVPSPIRRLVGSERPIIDPIESDVKNTFAFVNAAERNRVAQAIANLSDAPNAENWIKRVPPPFRQLRVGEAEVTRAVGKGLGASPGDVRNALHEEFGVDMPDSFVLALRPQSFLPPESRTIAVMVGGRPRYYQLEPSLYRATMGLDREPSNLVVRMLSIPSRLLRAGATITPEFWTRNIVRDQMTAFLQSEYQIAPPVNFLRGLFHAIKRDDLFWEYQRSGAGHSALVSLDRPYVQEAVRKMTEPPDMVDHIIGGVSHPLSLMEAWSELGEMATRLADFEAGKQQERPGVEGLFRRGYNAREVTVDFGRMGASMQAINSLIAFSNARVQGVDRFVRAFKDNPSGTATRVAAGIMLPSLLLWAAFHKDKRYQDRPAYEKDQFWIIPTDKGVMRIPKPFEPGILFGSLAERALDYAHQRDPRGMEQWTQSFLQGMSPGIMPTAIAPLVDVWSNQSSMSNRPIVPRTKEGVEPRYQSTDYSTELARRLGDVVNYSPAKIDALIRGYTGGIGLLTAEGISALMNLQRPARTGEAPSGTLADIPVVRSFVGREPTSQADPIERFYETYQAAAEKQKTFTSLKTLDPDRATQYADQHQQDLQLAAQLGEVAHAFAGYRKTIEGFTNDPNMPGRAKRVAIDDLTREMADAARAVNAQVAETQRANPPAAGPGALERIMRLVRPAPTAEAR